MSFGTDGDATSLHDAVDHAAANNVLCVASVGNEGVSSMKYPAAYSSVVGVGSVGETLEVSDFSQRNTSVFVTAPGEDIVSLSYADPVRTSKATGRRFPRPWFPLWGPWRKKSIRA
jgi:subtilisin family serine protease